MHTQYTSIHMHTYTFMRTHIHKCTLHTNMHICMHCVALYLYIYIALLAVHTNQKHFQRERDPERREHTCRHTLYSDIHIHMHTFTHTYLGPYFIFFHFHIFY